MEQDKGSRAQADQSLVERAQQGDTEAFGELIQQHRSQARGWAEKWTGDPHMADDVVQDALIRAFLHLGSLADTSRFLPWLHRIVRNQANMRLRRGGPYGKERPFSAMGTSSGTQGSRVNWEDLDSLLYHLARTAADAAAAQRQDPGENLLRKELYETIQALLHCLTPKEREIFKAYFFRQLKPEEMAAMFRMTTGSIYTYIHRSRLKLRKEHIRVSLGFLPEKRERSGIERTKVLQLNAWPAHGSVKTTFIDSLGRMLAMMGDRRDMAELMGQSTFAFRMKISAKTTFADGLYMFDWKAAMLTVMEDLGYAVTVMTGQLADAPVPLLGAVERFPVVLSVEEVVLPFIRKYIDMGNPVMMFDTMCERPYIHEWVLVYGYDEERRILYTTDPLLSDGKTISYEDMTRNPVRFLAGVDGRKPAKETSDDPAARKERPRQAAEHAIRFAVEYARRGCAYRPRTNYLHYASGLAAYDTWIQHLRSAHVAPNRYGLGQLTVVYAESKQYAAHYLRGVPMEGEAKRLVLLASEAYEQAAEALEELSGYVPFVRTFEVLAPERREACALFLDRAREFETAAIGYLEKAILTMEKERSR